jgi:YfiH family protein
MSPACRWVKRGRLFVGAAEALIGLPGVGHAFTTRLGGVSPRPYATLNLQLKPGEDTSNRVAMNRQLLAAALGYEADRLVTADQVHGDTVTVVDVPGVVAPACDALITTQKNLPILIQVADCLPVVMADPAGRGVAVVHCGWRGVAAGIAVKAAQQLAELTQSRVEDLAVGVGPGIGPCCFAVHEDVTAPLAKAVPTGPAPVERNGRLFVDLAGTLSAQLTAAGLTRQSVAHYCNACHGEMFFSYRRDAGKTGRQGVVAWLTD